MHRLLTVAAVSVMLSACASAPRTEEEKAANRAEIAKVEERCKSLGLDPKNDAYTHCRNINVLLRGL